MQIQNEGEGGGNEGADGAAGAASGGAAAGGAAEKLVTPPAEGKGAVGGGDTEWMPAKFQVMKEDGTLDADASARKLAASYTALESHKGALPAVPATPADYKLEPTKNAEGKPVDGIDFEGFVADPLFKGFVDKAHAAGLTNAQLQFVTDEYLTLAPQLLGANAELTAAEARAELGKLWTDDATANRNLASVSRAIQGFGGEAPDMPGSRQRLFDKFGNDPDFIAFAAKVAGEMKEDQPPGGTITADMDIEALQKSEAYWKPTHPDHAATKAKVADYYARKFGAAPK